MPETSPLTDRPDADATNVTAGSRAQANLDLALIGNCASQRAGRRPWRASSGAACRASTATRCSTRCSTAPSDGPPADGAFGIELEGLSRAEQSYDPGTAVVRTRLFDAAGEGIEIVDFCPRFLNRDRTFRPAQIVRRVRPLVGHPRVRFVVRPRGDWGAATPELTRGSNHLRYVAAGLHAAAEHERAADLRARRAPGSRCRRR